MIEKICLYLIILISLFFLIKNIKNLTAALIGLTIILFPLGNSVFLKGSIYGARGISVIKLLWFVSFTVFIFYILLNKSKIEIKSYFSLPIIIFTSLYLFACLITFVSGKNHTFYLSGHTRIDIIYDKILKTSLYILTGWMVFILLKDKDETKSKDKEVILNAIFYTSILIGILSFLFFLTKGSLHLYTEGRSAIKKLGIHPNSLGALCVYLYIIASTIEVGRYKMLKNIAILFSLIGIVFSFSRIAWLTTIAITLIMMKKMKLSTKFFLFFVLSMIVILGGNLLKSRIMFGVNVRDNYPSNDVVKKLDKISAGRVAIIWGPALKMISQKPIFGHGIGCDVKLNKYYTIPPHNAYLKVLLDMGIVGLFALIIFLLSWYKKSSKEKGTFYYLIIAFCMLTLTGHSFYPYKGNYILWVIYGIFLSEENKFI